MLGFEIVVYLFEASKCQNKCTSYLIKQIMKPKDINNFVLRNAFKFCICALNNFKQRENNKVKTLSWNTEPDSGLFLKIVIWAVSFYSFML